METTHVGFFDESGIHAGARILAFGGLVAPLAAWDSFAPKWDHTLKEAGVESGVFHFSDFDNGRGEFQGWSQLRKANLMRDLFRIIKRLDPFAVCGAIIMPDYKEVVNGSGTVLEEKHSPYVICHQFCIEMICKRMDARVFYICDQQLEFDSPAKQNFWDAKARFPEWAEKMDAMVFRSKKQFSPLQAADLFTYETAKSLHNRLFDQGRPIRKSMTALLKSIRRERLEGGYFNKDGSRVILEWNRVARN